MAKEQEYKFSGRVERCVYNSEDFKVYALAVDLKKYPNIKQNKFNNVTISGELSDLTIGVEYEITGIEAPSKNGMGYRVLNIRRDIPTTAEDMFLFLQEILTPNQAKVLYDVYPDIVQRVKENRLDDIDLNKLKGIKEYTFKRITEKITENFCLADLVIEFQGYLNLSIIKKIYNKYTSVDKIKEQLNKDPYKCLCRLAGVGFKTADSTLLEIEKVSNANIAQGKEPIMHFSESLISSPQRCLACIMYLLEENENAGHTKMNLAELRTELLKTVPACANHFAVAMKSPDIFYNKETMDAALVVTQRTEQSIANTILQYVHHENVWDYDVEKYREINGSKLSDEQVQAVKNVCKYTISILNGAGGCVDCDTEYFNGKEWKPISEYKDGEKVLQYNKNGTATLEIPEEYHKKICNKMWHFETKYGLNQCLSDEHRVVYETSRGHLKIRPFREIINMHNNSMGFTGKFYTSFDYSGNGIKLSDDEIRIMIATFADGSFYTKENGNHPTRSRFHLKKGRKQIRLVELAQKAKLPFRIINSKTIDYMDIYIDVPIREKHFPNEWFNCNKHQLEIIADEVMYWNGNYKKHNCYCTTYKQDADFIQFVYSSLGYRASISVYNRMGEKQITETNEYIRKSIDYVVCYTTRNKIQLNTKTSKESKKTIIEPYNTKDGFKYCFTMPSSMWIARRNNCIFVTGNTGKSYSTQAIINMLKEHHKSFHLFSPTGKAAKVLADYTKETASTIHRGLYYQPIDNWGFNKDHKLKTDIVIIDEFSMVDIWLFKRVLDAIDFETTKLLMIGDNAQLCSVGCGNLLHDFMQSNLIPTVTLTKVFRYGEGGLMKVATDVRFCKTYLANNMKNQMTVFGDNKDYTFVDLASEIIPQHAVALYKKLMSKGYSINDIQVLTAKNVGDCGTVTLNNMLQKVANPNYGSSISMKCAETTYYIGDLVIQKANNYKALIDINSLSPDERDYYYDLDEAPTAFIANGETGVVKDIMNSYILIDFDGVIVKYTKADLINIGLGYSISIHKSQGSSIKAVILLTPQSHKFMLNSNLLYVGLTRMKEVCYHLGTLSTVNEAVKKKANLTRHTFMQEMLISGKIGDDTWNWLKDVETAQLPESKESSDTEFDIDNRPPWDEEDDELPFN